MDLVERELSWVLKSPAFFSAEAAAEARSQLSRDFVVALPGSVIYPDIYDPLSSAESCSYLSESSLWQVCVNELHQELPLLTSGRLGLRFEQYLLSILRAQFGSSNVRHRWAVRETLPNHSVKTWGEYDFLIFNASMNRVEHWESSVKFYLQIQDNSDWKWCWGPGVVDRLDLKGPKTFLQQLALSSTELGHASIPAEWRSVPLVKRVFAKGTIFYRWLPREETFEERLRTIVLPRALADDHLKSWWIDPQDLAALRVHYPRTRIALIPRKFWMTGVDVDTCGPDSFESWEEFSSKLDVRLKAAAERKECLYIGLYSDEPNHRLVTAGFVSAPHFTEAISG